MPAKKYHVELTEKERCSVEQMLRRGKHSARKLTRARILLKAAAGLRDEAIAQAVDTCVPTVERTRKRFAEGSDRLMNARDPAESDYWTHAAKHA